MTTVNLHLSGDASDLPLVLLAPFPLDARLWDEVVERLADADGPHRVIAVDPPGFGGAIAGGEPSLEAYADALLSALDAAGVDRFVLAGNSMGGYVAMLLADRHPQRLAGIGLIGTKSTADTDEARDGRVATAARLEAGGSTDEVVEPMNERMISAATRAEQPETVRALRDWMNQAPAASIAWALRAMAARPDRTAALKALDVPGLVLCGSDDVTMTWPEQELMAEALGESVTAIDRVGHLIPLEAPDATAAALIDLWNRAAARS
ncbi:alpha/beta hydrolase [Ammonicoccus fulvus]|uniref:Alpha/beta hydrolase n=1 Tax=Ammonicoccus fulvus TaxID=3138240 RepID=A0ABZ3FT62_9ACTN